MINKEIKERWIPFQQNGSISADLLKNIIESPPFESINDNIDLRGIKLLGIEIADLNFNNVDFGYSIWKNCKIEKNHFHKVSFEGAKIIDSSEINNIFNKCNFLKTNFAGSVLGYEGTKFISNTFVEALFSGVGFIRPRFNTCHFINCKLKGVDFEGSSFKDCSFFGKLESVWFRGQYSLKSSIEKFGMPEKNNMENVSFKDAILRDVVFADNLDLSRIILPEGEEYIYITNYKELIDELKLRVEKLEGDLKLAIEKFVMIYGTYANSQDQTILILADIKEFCGSKVVDYIRFVSEDLGNVSN